MSINISQSSESQNLTQLKTERLELSVRKGWTPPPRISVPQWADDFRKLAKEAGSNSGNWETSTVEIARGPMLAATESGVHIITVMCCTQLMKTALLENLFGYFAHLDPCPILLLQPKEEAAEQFSKERISPLVRVTPVLRKIIGDSKQKSSKETILYKAFTGGFLALAGAGSPDNLARRPIRVLLADEVDKYPITREGDPIALAEERTATFGLTWLSVRACSPTVEDESRIADSYADSDQRRASVICPHCGHRQFLDFFKHVHQGYRHTGLNAGETVMYNQWAMSILLTEQGVFVDAKGKDVEVNNATNVTINASKEILANTPLLKCTGDVVDNCETNTTTLKQLRDAYNDHDHDVENVQSGDITRTSEKTKGQVK